MARRWTENPDPTIRIRLVRVLPNLWLICPTRWDEEQQGRAYVPADEARGALARSFPEALEILADMLAGRWKW